MNQKFETGNLVMTTGIYKLMTKDHDFEMFVWASLVRFLKCDWGTLNEDDIKLNEEGLKNGDRLMGAYEDDHERKIWIITEADRSGTTVLFPSEY